MKYKITVERIDPANEQRSYDKEIEIYNQTLEVSDEAVFMQGIVAEVNKLPRPE